MDADKFKNDLMIGETSSIEFKRCGNEVEHDVFESICAFLNRFGGDVYLGVLNDGTVVGVTAQSAAAMMKNIINVVGNPNVFKPSPYIEVESFVWDGKTVIRVHVPVSGDVHSYHGDIYDRMGEVDVKILATAQIADLYMRKKGIYTEREVFPQLKLDDFRLDMLPLVRREAQNHLTDGKRHPWMDMDDETLPVFTEGNNFVISVSLKKLDPIRFPFGKLHIGEEKPHIGDEKPHIGDKKPHIGDEKPYIEGLLSGLGLTRPTEENIFKLFQRFGEGEIFGRHEVRDTTGLQDRASSALIGQMLRHRLLDTVKGHGKGKYRFRSEFSGTNT